MGELTFQFLSNFIAITIPLLFVAFMIGDERSKRIILYFCWGTFAAALAYNINNSLGFAWVDSAYESLLVAPIIEEICKALPVLLFLNRKKYPELTKTIIFCAMAVGIGFSIQESMYYFATSSREIIDVAFLVARTLTTSLMHGMTTAIIGIGILITNNHKFVKILSAFGLLAVAIGIHSLYNYLLQTNLAIIAMLMPIGMFVAVWVYVRKLEK